MDTIEIVQENNKITKEEFDNISNLLFKTFLVEKQQDISLDLVKQNELLDYFTSFLNKYMQLRFLTSSKDKLALMHFIHKLNLQKELLELQAGITNLANIQIAAQRLGKKSQSAFESKQPGVHHQ